MRVLIKIKNNIYIYIYIYKYWKVKLKRIITLTKWLKKIKNQNNNDQIKNIIPLF